MSGSVTLQFEKVKMKFDSVVKKNKVLESANKNLEEAVILLQRRLEKSESQKEDLIEMFKDRNFKHKEKIRHLENEITHLHSLMKEKDANIEELKATVHKQSDVIEDQINTIDNCKNEIRLIKLQNNQSKRKTLRKQKSSEFTHPVFLDYKVQVKKRPKKNFQPSFRWSNLDITKESEVTNESLKTQEKRRKLYSISDEDIISIASEDEK